MTFDVAGEVYDRFMGRFSVRLAPLFADFAGVTADLRVLDVGCGPGALTTELVRRVGAKRVAAVDPSPSFVAATRERLPEADVREGTAEQLPFRDGEFDAALSQLVVAFMQDAAGGVADMCRVTRDRGVVAVTMWDSQGEMQLLQLVNGSARAVAPDHPAVHGPRRYGSDGELRELFEHAGLHDVETAPLDVEAGYDDFDDLWTSVAAGVGPIGDVMKDLDEEGIARFREEIRSRLGDPTGAFTLTGRAWAVRGTVG